MPDRVELSGSWLIESLLSSIEELRSVPDGEVPVLTEDEIKLLTKILSQDKQAEDFQAAI